MPPDAHSPPPAPPTLAATLRDCLRHYHNRTYVRWRLTEARRLARFRDRHRGEDVFVIGNGPSLNRTDLTRLAGRHTFGLNKIYLLFDRIDLRPSYYVAVNDLVIAQSSDRIRALGIPAFLSYRRAPRLIGRRDHLHYLYTRGPHLFHTDLTRWISEGHTVTFVALQIAYYMGFRRVFLVGVDHRYTVDAGRPNEVRRWRGDDCNHFDRRYFKNADWNLPDLAGSELSYRMARLAFERAGRRIYDATVDGCLTVFPRIDYERALAMTRPRA